MKLKSLVTAIAAASLVVSLPVQATSYPPPPPKKNSFSGRAFVAQIKALGIGINVVDTGQLPPTGGSMKSIVGKKGAITVNALHVTVGNILPILPPIADVIVSSAHSDIKCI